LLNPLPSQEDQYEVGQSLPTPDHVSTPLVPVPGPKKQAKMTRGLTESNQEIDNEGRTERLENERKINE